MDCVDCLILSRCPCWAKECGGEYLSKEIVFSEIELGF